MGLMRSRSMALLGMLEGENHSLIIPRELANFQIVGGNQPRAGAAAWREMAWSKFR
jgi:hypothetical protein